MLGLRHEPEKGASWTCAARGITALAQANVWGQPDRKTRGRESFNFYRFQKATLDMLGLRPEPEKGASWTCAVRMHPAYGRQIWGQPDRKQEVEKASISIIGFRQ